MKSKRQKFQIPVKFLPNLLSALLAGLTVGLAVGLILGLKVAKINPSIVGFPQIWLLTSHIMGLYTLAGAGLGAVLGLIFYPFLRKKGSLALHSAFNLYLITIVILAFAYYIRTYIITHFISNPLAPIKGSLGINIAFSVVFLALAISGILFAIRLTANWRFKPVVGISGGVILLIWIWLGIFKTSPVKSEIDVKSHFVEFSPRPTEAKVALIGIDGAWWEVLDSVMAKGELPHFQSLEENGTRANLKTLYPTFSAMIWTSVITGKLPQKHGINSFLVWSFPITGVEIPLFRLPWLAPELLWAQEHIATVSSIPSTYRSTEALWNIFSDQGLKVGIMGWFASWPAETVNGYLFTDHALYNKLEILTNYKQRKGASLHDIYPPELIPELQRFTFTPKDISDSELDRFIKVDSDSFRKEFQTLDTYNYIDIAYEASMFKFSFPSDKTTIEAGKYLLDKCGQPRFWAIYLQGMDSMSHQYLKYHFAWENQDKLIPVNINRYSDLVKNYYIYMDEMLGEFLARFDPQTYILIVSDHGFEREMLPSGHYHHIKPDSVGESEEFHITNSHPGIFIASGPGLKKGYQAESVNILDIAPTILNIMGFPYAMDMDGKILTEIFDQPLPSDTIPTYDKGRKTSTEISETPVDKEIRDKLKALGYVK